MNYGYILILNFAVLFVVILTVLVLIVKYARLCIKYNKLYKYMYNHLNLITAARYGNFNNKIENGIDALTIQLSRNTNALLESIIDRDKMIREYIEKEKQSQNIKQDFISCLAHDLKVPIIAQDNTYDLFLDGNFGVLNEIQKKAIKNLKVSNLDLKNLVLNFLDVQRFENALLNLNFERVNLVDFIKSVIEQNALILKTNDKQIHFSFNDNEIYYDIDIQGFKRVLNNLITNAIYYAKEAKNIYVELNKNEKNIQIIVKDEGKGIKEEDINNIFKKYYTCAKKYSNVSYGLGLYISNKIINAHNGKIEAKNNSDGGASFIIIF